MGVCILNRYEDLSEINGEIGGLKIAVNSANERIDGLINSKQDTLVSGSNIVWINGKSILTSGNLSLQPTLTAGTGISIANNTIKNEFKYLSAPNLDSVTYNFLGYCVSATNRPSRANQHGYLIAIQRSDTTDYTLQYWVPYDDSTVWIRRRTKGTWGAWTSINWLYRELGELSDCNLDVSSFVASAMYVGYIKSDSASNVPVAKAKGLLFHEVQNATNYGRQFFVNDVNIYTRALTRGTWGSWLTLSLSNHTHGTITSDGKIATNVSVAENDRLLIKRATNNAIASSGIVLGNPSDATLNNTFLNKRGNWVDVISAPSTAFSLNGIPCAGYITTAAKDLTFLIPYSKTGKSVTCNSLELSVRGTTKASSTTTVTMTATAVTAKTTTDVLSGYIYFKNSAGSVWGMSFSNDGEATYAGKIWNNKKAVYSNTIDSMTVTLINNVGIKITISWKNALMLSKSANVSTNTPVSVLAYGNFTISQ